jgi:hypothetical protein
LKNLLFPRFPCFNERAVLKWVPVGGSKKGTAVKRLFWSSQPDDGKRTVVFRVQVFLKEALNQKNPEKLGSVENL